MRFYQSKFRLWRFPTLFRWHLLFVRGNSVWPKNLCDKNGWAQIEKISTKISVLQFDTRPNPRLFESSSLRFRRQSQFPFRNVLRANFQIGFWDNLFSKVGQNCQKLWVCFDKCHDNFTAIWGSPSLGTFNTQC